MKHILILLIVFSSVSLFSQNTNFQWAHAFGGNDWDAVTSVVTDQSGNQYLIGTFKGTVDFDPSTAVVNKTSNGYEDIFVIKLDLSGNFQWVQTFGGTSNDFASDIKIVNNQIIIGGTFQGISVDFNPGSATNTSSSAGSYDAFILKLTVDSGNYVWHKTFGGSGLDYVTAFDINNTGDIIIGGYFSGTSDFDPSTSFASKTAAGMNDIYVNRLSSTGNFIGVSVMGGTDDDQLNELKINSNNEIIIAGTFKNSADFDPDTTTHTINTNGYMEDVFIEKLSSTGTFVWVKSFGGYDGERLQGMCLDASDNIYSTGDFFMEVDFNPGPAVYNLTCYSGNNVYIQKLNTNGNFEWARSFGGNNPDLSYDIQTDADGNVYTLGIFSSDKIDLNPNADSSFYMNISSGGPQTSNDIFLQKLDHYGNYIYGKTFGSTWFDGASKIAFDNDLNVFIVGDYEGDTLFFDGLKQNYVVSKGGTDGYIVKLSQFFPLFSPSQVQLNNPPFDISFTNNITDTTNLRWFWNFGDGVFSSTRSPQHTYLYDGTYEVSLLAFDTINGTSDTATQEIICSGGGSNPCNFTPQMNQTGAAIICATDSFKLSVTSQPGQTYSWFYNGITMSGENSSELWAQKQGFYMAVVSENNCSKTTDYFALANYPFNIPNAYKFGTIAPCTNDSVLIWASPNYSNYLWNTSSTNDSIYVSESGRYTVKVVDNFGCTVESNEVIVNASAADIPSICMVGNDSVTQKNVIIWQEPISTTINSFNIYRESFTANDYQLIGNVPFGGASKFMDNASNTSVKQYRYRIAAMDTCGTETPMSDIHTTMHLMLNATLNNHWNLIWQPYQGLNVLSYKIYRGTDTLNMNLLTTVSGNNTSYSDLTNPTGDIYYKVEAITTASCAGHKIKSNTFNTNDAGGVGIAQLNNSEIPIHIYPNPSDGRFTISNLNFENSFNLQIIDLSGRILFAEEYSNTVNKIEINQNLKKGIYIIKIQSAKKLISSKIIFN